LPCFSSALGYGVAVGTRATPLTADFGRGYSEILEARIPADITSLTTGIIITIRAEAITTAASTEVGTTVDLMAVDTAAGITSLP